MLNFSKFRFFFILGVCLLSIIFLVPNFYGKSEITAFPTYFPKKQFNLGLDLQGGSHLLLEVDVNTVLKEKSNDVVDEVRKILRKKKIKYSNLGSRGIGATVTIKDINIFREARILLKDSLSKDIIIEEKENRKLNFSFSEEKLLDIKVKTVNQSIEVIRKRVDETGTREPNIQKQGEDRIVVQLPGIKNPERVKALIGRTAKLNFHLLDPTTVELAEQRGKLPPGTFKVPNADPSAYEKEFIVKKKNSFIR